MFSVQLTSSHTTLLAKTTRLVAVSSEFNHFGNYREIFAVLMASNLISLYFRILFSLVAHFDLSKSSWSVVSGCLPRPLTRWLKGAFERIDGISLRTTPQCLYSSVCFYRNVCEGRAWLVHVPVGRVSQAHELDLIHAGAYGVFTHGAECVSCVRLSICHDP